MTLLDPLSEETTNDITCPRPFNFRYSSNARNYLDPKRKSRPSRTLFSYFSKSKTHGFEHPLQRHDFGTPEAWNGGILLSPFATRHSLYRGNALPTPAPCQSEGIPQEALRAFILSFAIHPELPAAHGSIGKAALALCDEVEIFPILASEIIIRRLA
jgi:hypothetical protein